MQDQKCRQKFAIWAPLHSFVGLYLRNKARIDIQKKTCYKQYLPHMSLMDMWGRYCCPYNMVKVGLLAVEIISLVWGTPVNFNGQRVLAPLLHGTLVLGVSETLRH